MSETVPTLALLTDLYELTMAYGYWKLGMAEREAVFHLNYRRRPFGGPYALVAGLESLVQCLRDFYFDPSDIAYLRTLTNPNETPLFEKAFLDYLSKLRLTCNISAMREGSLAFPKQPILRVQGPVLQAQLLESVILNQINFQSLIATKAMRVCKAAAGDPVIEFGMRRAQGIDGAISASRAAFIGGCESTSNTLAGKLFGIPVRGTQAHSWIMAFDSEKSAFEAYAAVMPDNCMLLVDTYDTLQGVRNAIEIGRSLREKGKKILGIRLDSGDITTLSLQSRQLLDEAGFSDVKILASNELDEHLIRIGKKKGSAVQMWGVGTKLVTASDQSALDGVYKLSAIRNTQGDWVDKAKRTDERTKVSDPGILQVRRYRREGRPIADVTYDLRLGISYPYEAIKLTDPCQKIKIDEGNDSEDLLIPILRQGKLVYSFPSLQEVQRYAQREQESLPEKSAENYFVGEEMRLYQLKEKLME